MSSSDSDDKNGDVSMSVMVANLKIKEQENKELIQKISAEVAEAKFKEFYKPQPILDQIEENKVLTKELQQKLMKIDELIQLADECDGNIMEGINNHIVRVEEHTGRSSAMSGAVVSGIGPIELKTALTKYTQKVDHDNLRVQLQSNIQNIKTRLQEVTTLERDVQAKIGAIQSMLDMSAGLEEVKDLQHLMKGFVSQDQLKEVDRKHYDYYPIKEAISMKNEYIERFEKVEEHLEKVPLASNTTQNLDNIQNQIKANMEQCVTEQSWERMNATFNGYFSEQRKWNKQVDKNFKDCDDRNLATQKLLAQKVSLKDLREIKVQIDQLPTVGEIREWKKDLRDDTEAFKTQMVFYKMEFEKQTQILLQYDVVLCDKASSQKMKETQINIEYDVNKQKNELMYQVGVIKDNMAKEVTKILTFQNSIEKEIIRIIESEKRKEMMRNGGSGDGNDILATDAGRNLKKQLLMKADRLDIEKLFEIKSNVTDTENMIECQGVLTKHTKHILILFIEILNLQTVKQGDPAQSREKRQNQLIQQCKTLSNWIMTFDPKNYVKNGNQGGAYDGSVDFDNQDVKNLSFKDYTSMVLKDIQRTNKSSSMGARKYTSNKTQRASFDWPGSVKNTSMRGSFQDQMFQSQNQFMVSDMKKKSQFERFGSIKPNPRDNNLSRNFVVVQNECRSPNESKMTEALNPLNQTDGFHYNQAETGFYLQSLTQVPRNQTFSAEQINSKRGNYVRKTNKRVFQQIKGMTTNSSLMNSPVQSGEVLQQSTEGTLDYLLDTKNLQVEGSAEIMTRAQTRDVSKKLKTSFSNPLADDSLDQNYSPEMTILEQTSTFDNIQKLKKLALFKNGQAPTKNVVTQREMGNKRLKTQIPELNINQMSQHQY